MNENFHYDVFLSHSEKDKATVRELAERLRKDGARVWFDNWMIKPGDSIPIKIAEGLEQSRILVLIISAGASESEWAQFEHQTVLFNDPTNKKRRFIPLKIDDSESRFHLKQFAYVDWRNRDEDEYQRLWASIFEVEEEAEPPKIHEEPTVEPNPVIIFKGHSSVVNFVAISSDEKFVVSGSADQTVRIWETETGKCLKILEGHTDFVWGVAISANGKFVVSSSNDGTVRLW